ncbi:MAG: glycosyltransferase [Lachnospiraceae bacterium]|nr:glycosyltransferase [Lachnospiraceae bacterium]
MNIFYLEWDSYCNEDVFQVLDELGHNVIKISYKEKKLRKEQAMERLQKALLQSNCDFVFSFNYFPEVSECCKDLGLKYVAWVYDSPHIQVYSYTVINPCNYIFLFDYGMYDELKRAGIETVYYLPLAVNEKRMKALDECVKNIGRYASDISFVGSLYSEKKHRIYDKFQGVDSFTKGYLDGIIQAQKRVHGYNFIQELLIPEIVAEMQKAYPTDPNATTVLSPEAIYAEYVLNRQVTALERREVLELLGERFGMMLYTNDRGVSISGVVNRGPVDYYEGMPYVFRQSKINLNITLRSIKTGIPLRVWDILGNEGFLLTNYQPEMFEYFVPDEDFVYYTDYEDMVRKVEYYLEHEEKRRRIARSGCVKVREEHTFQKRFETILEVVSTYRD